MVEKSVLGSKSSAIEPSMAREDSIAGNGVRRTYSPPRLLSAETLELAAAICNGTGGFGKAFPQCNPATPGS